MELFGITEGIIVQQVNCQNEMWAGLAKAIYEQVPAVKEDYTNSFKNTEKTELFGKYRVIDVTDKLKVANLYTQFDFANPNKPETMGKLYTDINKLTQAIENLHNEYPIITIYVPRNIGCGLGGAKWDQVLNNIKDIKNVCILDTMNKVTIDPNKESINQIIDRFDKMPDYTKNFIIKKEDKNEVKSYMIKSDKFDINISLIQNDTSFIAKWKIGNHESLVKFDNLYKFRNNIFNEIFDDIVHAFNECYTGELTSELQELLVD